MNFVKSKILGSNRQYNHYIGKSCSIYVMKFVPLKLSFVFFIAKMQEKQEEHQEMLKRSLENTLRFNSK